MFASVGRRRLGPMGDRRAELTGGAVASARRRGASAGARRLGRPGARVPTATGVALVVVLALVTTAAPVSAVPPPAGEVATAPPERARTYARPEASDPAVPPERAGAYVRPEASGPAAQGASPFSGGAPEPQPLTSPRDVLPPANDDFAQALVLTGPSGSAAGTNRGASRESGEPYHLGEPGGTSVWYQWTAPSDGLAVFDTSRSLWVDTVLAVYTGSAVNSLSLVVGNDNYGSRATSKVGPFEVTGGTTYRVAVDGKRKSSSDELVLNWFVSPGYPDNDDFVDAQAIAGSSGTVTGSNLGATKEPGEPFHAGVRGGASVWYSWTAPSDGQVLFDTAGSDFNTVIAVYTGTAVSSLSLVAYSNFAPYPWKPGAGPVAVTGGTTYHIAVDGYDGEARSLTLSWSLAVSPPPNDDFVASERITGPTGSVTGTILGATREPGEPAWFFGPSVWYSWTAPSDGLMVFDTNGSTFSARLAVYTGSALNGLTYVTSADRGGARGTSRVRPFEVTAGVVYHIVVTRATTAGAITLNWSPGSLPANDRFADAELLTGPSGTVTATNTDATVEPGEPAGDSYSGYLRSSVWYSWTAPSDGVVAFEAATTRRGWGFSLNAYTGSAVDALTDVGEGYNPDVWEYGREIVVTAGTTYTVAIAADIGIQGPFTLTWKFLPGAPTVALGSASVVEGDSGARTAYLTVTLSKPVASPVTVGYTADRASTTARDGIDYFENEGTLTFPPGSTHRTIPITILGDLAAESHESIGLRLTPVDGALAHDRGAVTVVNDDPPGRGRRVSIGDATVAEGDEATRLVRVTVTLSKPSSSTVTVAYATLDGNAVSPEDYTAKSGTIRFAPGVTSRVLSIAVSGDRTPEGMEELTVALSDPVNALLGLATGTIKILDQPVDG